MAQAPLLQLKIPKHDNSKKFSTHEKKAISIVLMGNFLEYFDLMLFSHLAFVITPSFMPKEDPVVAKMLSILTFCSAFAIKPLAAYFWGYLGDHFGRVVVLSQTTLIMALTCMMLPNIPLYEEWGIYSTLAVILCRVLQGFSSAGESKCAEVFVVEISSSLPKTYLTSVLVPITCDLGGFFAAIIGSLCLAFSPEKGWKVAFYVGAAVAFSSSIARLKLRETKEFLSNIHAIRRGRTIPVEHRHERRNFIALLGLNLICPTAFYFAYSVGSDLLKDKIDLSSSAIIFNNSFLLLSEVFFLWICARLAARYHPFLILKIRTYVSFILMPLSFASVIWFPTHTTIFLAQCIAILSTASFDPAAPIIIRSFAIGTRFSKYAKASAFSKAIMYISTGYLTYYMESLFGLWGVLGLLLFFSGIFLISLHAFVPNKQFNEVYKNESDENDRTTKDQQKMLKQWMNVQ